MASDERRLQHGGGEVIDGILRKKSADSCPLARPERGNRLAIVVDLACCRSPKARKDTHERRLAGTIGSDHGPALAGSHVKVEAGNKRAARDDEREAAARKQGYTARHERTRVRSASSTGTPTSAVITPTGN